MIVTKSACSRQAHRPDALGDAGTGPATRSAQSRSRAPGPAARRVPEPSGSPSPAGPGAQRVPELSGSPSTAGATAPAPGRPGSASLPCVTRGKTKGCGGHVAGGRLRGPRGPPGLKVPLQRLQICGRVSTE